MGNGIIKIGKRRGIQRYLCKDCKKKFQYQRRPEQLQKIIFQEYFLQRQTLKQLASKYDRSLEGGVFSHMKNMISLHRGISKGLK